MSTDNIWTGLESRIQKIEKEIQKMKDLTINVRKLTYDEYRFVKSTDWTMQTKLFEAHLGKAGFERYRTAYVRGGKSKYPTYCEIFTAHNSKLGQALK